MDLTNGQTTQRQLASPIDLNKNETTYISILISKALDNSEDTSTEESLSIDLQSEDSTTQVSFGVESDEQFYIAGIGNTKTTSTDKLDPDQTYFLIAKISSMNDASGTNADQILLKTFTSGENTIPASESDFTWTLVGETTENKNAIIDRIAITAGSQATFSVDEIRIGTSYQSVAYNTTPSCPTTLQSDLNKDCYVNFLDLAIIARDWLICTNPGDTSNCW